MRSAVLIAAIAAGCGKGDKPAETGRMCFAANPPEVFVWQEEGATRQVDYLADKPTAIRFRKQAIEQPGREVAIADAKEGELVELVRGGKVSDSFRISFKKLGRDLCYFFRPYRDKAMTARWILDSNREKSRCSCFPIPPSAVDAGVSPPG